MTRPNKHAARFGDDFWRIPTYADVDPRKVVRALRSFRPVVARMTQNIHAVRERWTYTPHVANMAAPTVAELQASSTPLRGVSSVSFGTHSGGDVLDIDTGSPSDDPLAGPEWATRYSRSSGPLTWTAATVTATSLREMSFGFRTPDDRPLLDRIDDTLLTYDSQRATGERPWPYRGF